MPFYDFKCVSCGKVFEKFCSYQQKPLCPDCGGETLRSEVYLTISTGLPNGHISLK